MKYPGNVRHWWAEHGTKNGLLISLETKKICSRTYFICAVDLANWELILSQQRVSIENAEVQHYTSVLHLDLSIWTGVHQCQSAHNGRSTSEIMTAEFNPLRPLSIFLWKEFWWWKGWLIFEILEMPPIIRPSARVDLPFYVVRQTVTRRPPGWTSLPSSRSQSPFR